MFSTDIKQYIESNCLIGVDDKVIVGLSGGADSVALLAVLAELRIPLVAAHCNFHLRGDESNRDERFCRDLCRRLGVELLTIDFDVASQMDQTGESVEMACRTLRYEWWRSLVESGAGSLIAVGHHREDNIETFFINLFRGCGLAGLKGMLPKNGRIIRPLLFTTRGMIEDYLMKKGLGFVTDSTNLEDEYRRNKIRLNIMPVIEREFPGASEAICRTMENLRRNHTVYTDHISCLQRQFTDDGGRIDVKGIIESTSDPATSLYELISPSGLKYPVAMDIIKSVTDGIDKGGRHFGTYMLDRGTLYTKAPEADNRELEIEYMTARDFEEILKSGKPGNDVLYLDADAVQGKHLSVREWRNGDRLAPFGMKGTRLVSDILSDAKIPLDEKKNVKIVECDGTILWVVGFRTSRHFPVTAATQRVAAVSFR